MRRLLLVFAVLCATAASAQPKLSAIIGSRDETNRSDRWPALGIGADFGNFRWRVRPDLGVALGLDPFNDGHETELSAGAVRYWHLVRARLHAGGGIAAVPGGGVALCERTMYGPRKAGPQQRPKTRTSRNRQC